MHARAHGGASECAGRGPSWGLRGGLRGGALRRGSEGRCSEEEAPACRSTCPEMRLSQGWGRRPEGARTTSVLFIFVYAKSEEAPG